MDRKPLFYEHFDLGYFFYPFAVVQSLARHSTITLSVDVYSHAGSAEPAGTVANRKIIASSPESVGEFWFGEGSEVVV